MTDSWLCSVQVQQGVPRRGGGRRQGVPAVQGAEEQGHGGAADRVRPGDAPAREQLLHLRHAGPLRRRHEARRQGVVGSDRRRSASCAGSLMINCACVCVSPARPRLKWLIAWFSAGTLCSVLFLRFPNRVLTSGDVGCGVWFAFGCQ